MGDSRQAERTSRKLRGPAVSLFTTFVLVALLDFGAGRHFLPPEVRYREPHAYYHHGLRAGTSTVTPWVDERHTIHVNSLAMKDASVRDVALRGERYRVVFMGDSFTEGWGLEHRFTFPGIVAGSLDAAGIEVLNAGVVSYSPKLYYLRTRWLIERGFEFDELFVMIDVSDVQDELVYEAFMPSSPGPADGLRGWLARNSYLYRRWMKAETALVGLGGRHGWTQAEYYRVRPLWSVDEREYEAWGERGLELAADNMDRLRGLCEEHSIKLSLAVYPWPLNIAALEHGVPRDDSVQQAFWRAFAEERGLDFVDLYPRLAPPGRRASWAIREFYIEGDIHWNKAGHRRVAESLLEAYFDRVAAERDGELAPRR